MSAIAGTVGFGNINQDTRPKSWMGLAWESDARQYTVAVVSSLMRVETVTDLEFNWFEQDIELFEVLSNGADATGSATTLTFKDAAGAGVNNNFRNRTLLKNDRTLEIVMINQDPAANTGAVNVTRAYQASLTAGLAVNDNDRWTILGFADEDNKTAPRAVTTEATRKTNFVQLMREPIDVGALTSQADLRTGPEYNKRRRIAFNQFLRRWERTWIHGEPKDVAGSTADTRSTTTGGLLYPITTNIYDFNGTVSETVLDRQLGKIGRWGSRSKLGLAGDTAINTVNYVSKFSGGTVYMLPGETTYGLRIKNYETAMMDLQMLYVPQLGTSTNYGGLMIVVDTAQLSRVVFRGFDFKLRKNVQDPSVLGIKDELLMAAALKLGLEKHHGVLRNMTSWVG